MSPGALQDSWDVLKGGAANLFGLLTRTGGRLIFVLIAGNLYGAAAFGRYFYLLAVIETLAAIAVFGMKRALFAFGEETDADTGAFERAILHALVLCLGLAAVLAGALYTVWPLTNLPQGAAWLPAMAALIPMIALSDVTLAATRYRRQMRYQVLARSIAEPWSLAGLAALAYFGGLGADGLFLAYAGSILVAVLFSIWGFSRLFSARHVLGAGFSGRFLRTMVTTAAPTMVNEFLNGFLRRLDVIILRLLAADAVLGVYGMAKELATNTQKTKSIFAPIIAPVSAQSLAAGRAGTLADLLSQVCRWVFTIQLLQLAGFALFGAALLSLFGDGMTAGALALTILVAAEVIEGSFFMSEYAIVYGRPNWTPVITGLGAAAVAGFAAVLAPGLGAVGAAMAVLYGFMILSFFRLMASRHITGKPILRARFIKPLAAALLATAIVLGIGQFAGLDLRHGPAALAGLAVLIVSFLAVVFALGISAEDRALYAALRQRSPAAR